MPIQPPFHPIVYVRGFAATMGEIEDTSATPYMGFNDGATKIRQNHKGEIVRFVFESPIIRLMKDEGYLDTYRNGSMLPPDQTADPRSIWIFRYYEQASKDLGTGERQTIPEIALDLRKFIFDIRQSVCGSDAAERKKFRVHLVGHSMGGLICRCYLQNLCAHGSGVAATDKTLELPSQPLAAGKPVDPSVHLVDKVFTYATPHNGIDLLGMNVPDLGFLDPFHVRNFNRDNMREYLKLPKNSPNAATLDGRFPTDHFFSLVGTNHDDYTAFFKMSKKATGPMSDGLVMISNAAVEGTPRAFVHRSHSGHYGIVNSEEGYQNLRRFLFGEVRVDAQLAADEVTLPSAVQEKLDAGKKVRASYHIETTARVRGALSYLHERRFDQASAILAEFDDLVRNQNPAYLFSGFLLARAKATNADQALAFAIRVAIRVPMYEIDNTFWFDQHFEGGYVFDETITLFVRRWDDEPSVRYGLQSVSGVGEAPHKTDLKDDGSGGKTLEIPLGFAPGARKPPRPGFRGRLLLRIRPWNR